MIRSWNSVLLNYSFSLVCVPKWPWALVSQVAVISFCKPSMNDYGKSCLQQFPLAFFPPTCLFYFFPFFFFFPDFQFPILPHTLQPNRLSQYTSFPLLSISLCSVSETVWFSNLPSDFVLKTSVLSIHKNQNDIRKIILDTAYVLLFIRMAL